jgi:hypothetical protein
MLSTRLACLMLAGLALAAGGCGSSKSTSQTTSTASAQSTTGKGSSTSGQSSTPSSPLTRAQLIAKGDAICYRLNVKRSTTTISSGQSYERLVPKIQATELAAATEMSELVPPPSMAAAWSRMVLATHTIAEATGHFRSYAEASNDKLGHQVDAVLTKGIKELTSTAKQEGFTDCAQFS